MKCYCPFFTGSRAEAPRECQREGHSVTGTWQLLLQLGKYKRSIWLPVNSISSIVLSPWALSATNLHENRLCRIPIPLIKVFYPPAIPVWNRIHVQGPQGRRGHTSPAGHSWCEQSLAEDVEQPQKYHKEQKSCFDIFMAKKTSVIPQKTFMRNSLLMTKLPLPSVEFGLPICPGSSDDANFLWVEKFMTIQCGCHQHLQLHRLQKAEETREITR